MSNLGKEDDDVVDKNDESEIVVIEDDPPEESISEDDIEVVETQPIAEDDDDDDDDLVAKDSNDRENIRDRRRKEKQDRKERRDNAIKRDKLELEFLRNRNDNLEKRLTVQEQRSLKGEIHGIDANIQQAQKEAEMADRVIAKAVEDGNGGDVAQAMKYRDQALSKMQYLSNQKKQASQVQSQPQQTTVDERTLHHAKKFMEDHPWYDQQGRDEESAIVMAIDQALAKDGYLPQSEEYWDELKVRASRRLPERFEKGSKTQRVARGGPAVGSGKEHAPASTRKEIYISPERKQALMDAGVWDDPVLRKKYVKRYAEYDKENRA
tara:strand:- start:125 stop:1093 length:969 start_codon:yes stop_codon:yes gene_type:complete